MVFAPPTNNSPPTMGAANFVRAATTIGLAVGTYVVAVMLAFQVSLLARTAACDVRLRFPDQLPRVAAILAVWGVVTVLVPFVGLLVVRSVRARLFSRTQPSSVAPRNIRVALVLALLTSALALVVVVLMAECFLLPEPFSSQRISTRVSGKVPAAPY